MKQNILWLKNNKILKQVDNNIQVIDSLPKRIYTMNYDQDRHEIFLEDYSDEFRFDFKVYGMESKFMKHIMKTYENTQGNLGILFNGVKGTGKTITAKLIANQMKLPVIIINAPYSGLDNFISKINCDCILFFDEFEKNFSSDEGNDIVLLSVMDGVFNSSYRRIFLLTTNKLCINENFIGRPSRIRYKKSFGNLSTEVVKEYLNDNLINKERIKEVLQYVDTLAISTIDILKCIVDELNIHDCSIDEFKSFMNIEQARYSYRTKYCVYYGDEDDSIEIFKNTLAKVGTKDPESSRIFDEDDLNIYSNYVKSQISAELLQIGEDFGGYGTIISTLDKDNIIVTENNNSRFYIKILNLNDKPSLYSGGLLY